MQSFGQLSHTTNTQLHKAKFPFVYIIIIKVHYHNCYCHNLQIICNYVFILYESLTCKYVMTLLRYHRLINNLFFYENAVKMHSILLNCYSDVLYNLHTCIWVLWLYISDKIYYACLSEQCSLHRLFRPLCFKHCSLGTIGHLILYL